MILSENKPLNRRLIRTNQKVKEYSVGNSLGKSLCKQLRVQLAINSPILLPDGSHFIFLNRLSYFDTILCFGCKLATVDELESISRYLFIDGFPLCPMLVWAIKQERPTLVKIKPGSMKPVKIKRTSSQYNLAYVIYIVPKNEPVIKA